MFVVLLTYKKPLDIIDQHLAEHRLFLDEGYRKNFLMASGPRTPRTGGVLLSQLRDSKVLEHFLKQDPFSIYDIADYEIIEFSPVKYHSALSCFLE